MRGVVALVLSSLSSYRAIYEATKITAYHYFAE